MLLPPTSSPHSVVDVHYVKAVAFSITCRTKPSPRSSRDPCSAKNGQKTEPANSRKLYSSLPDLLKTVSARYLTGKVNEFHPTAEAKKPHPRTIMNSEEWLRGNLSCPLPNWRGGGGNPKVEARVSNQYPDLMRHRSHPQGSSSRHASSLRLGQHASDSIYADPSIVKVGGCTSPRSDSGEHRGVCDDDDALETSSLYREATVYDIDVEDFGDDVEELSAAIDSAAAASSDWEATLAELFDDDEDDREPLSANNDHEDLPASDECRENALCNPSAFLIDHRCLLPSVSMDTSTGSTSTYESASTARTIPHMWSLSPIAECGHYDAAECGGFGEFDPVHSGEHPTDRRCEQPTDMDCLLGRGGRTNRHPGNKRYLKEKERLRPQYLTATGKEAKARIGRELVNSVYMRGGRFLKLAQGDDGGDGGDSCQQWYEEVPYEVALKKAKQALRQNNSPEARAAKRIRYSRY